MTRERLRGATRVGAERPSRPRAGDATARGMFASPNRAEIGRLSALAWPVALTNLQWIALNVVDVVMVGHASTEELAFFGAGRLGNWVALIIGIAALTGVQVFAARADGAGDRIACGAVFRQGVLFALAMGAGMMIPTLLFADGILRLAGVPDELAGGGAAALRAMALNFPGQFLLAAASLFLEGLSRPRVAMVVALLTVPLNILFNWLLIFGVGGVPALGAVGAALGTTLANLVGAALILAYVARMPDRAAYGLDRPWRGSWREGRALRRFGLAPGLASGFENSGFAILIALSTQLGAAAAGAFQVMISVHVVTIALPLGFASAAAVRVGNAMGAGERDDIGRRTGLAVGLALAALLPWTAAYLLMPEALSTPFSADPAVRAAAAAMIVAMAAFLWADAVQIVTVFALRAAGDQVAAGVIQAVSYFGVMTLLGWLFVHRLGAGPEGIALAMGIGLATAAIAGVVRLRIVTRRLARA